MSSSELSTPVALTVTDLMTIARMIEVASVRNCFRLSEFSVVKGLYDRTKSSAQAFTESTEANAKAAQEDGDAKAKAAPPAPDLTAADLFSLYELIDSISQRNGFKLDEFDIVKGVYDRLGSTVEESKADANA
jgi:hypothetical protein